MAPLISGMTRCRAAAVTAISLLLMPSGATAPATADPADPSITPAVNQSADPNPAPPPLDNGMVASASPAIAHTEDGRTLTVVAANETQLPIPPLTTSLSSRDWLAGGTFTGTVTGSATGGTLEVGYQIGCGIELNQVRLGGSLGGTFGNASLGPDGFDAPGTIAFPIQGTVEVRARPGSVTTAIVIKKDFKGTGSRVIVKDIHVNVDGCVGASTLRSYALLRSSSPHTEDVVAYYGIPKVF